MDQETLLSKIPDLDADDFTVYIHKDRVDASAFRNGDHTLKLQPSQQQARACVVKCHGGVFLSITVRRIGQRAKATRKPHVPCDRLFTHAKEDLHEGFLNTREQISETIFSHAVSTHERRFEPQGLVAIFGATETGKTSVATRLVEGHLNACSDAHRSRTRARRPHLVTFEDPIEHRFVEEPRIPVDDSFLEYEGLDYTPRLKGTDVADLGEALQHALRQTPSLFYAGETRDEADLNRLLAFARTGHLVVTTAHAGSLTEAMGKLLRAANANTAAARSVVAHSLIAVVHLLGGCEQGLRFTAPALWRGTPAARMSLTSDGLGSILPFNDLASYSLGRRSLVRILAGDRSDATVQSIVDQAGQWDLEGL